MHLSFTGYTEIRAGHAPTITTLANAPNENSAKKKRDRNIESWIVFTQQERRVSAVKG